MKPKKPKPRGQPPKKPINEKTTVELGFALKVGSSAVAASFVLGGLATAVATQDTTDIDRRLTNLENAAAEESLPPQINFNAFIDTASTGTGSTPPLTAQVDPN